MVLPHHKHHRKTYLVNKQNIILYGLLKTKLKKVHLCRALNCSEPTLNSYIDHPGLMRLDDLTIVAGCFGIHVETLVYCLRRGQQQAKKVDKWYINERTLEGERLIAEMEQFYKGVNS